MLTPLEIDAIGELFNLGLGAGTAALSEMTGRRVSVSVPRVSITYSNGHGLPAGVEDSVAVSLGIKGDLEGIAVMYLPDESGLHLARVVHLVWVDQEDLADQGPDFILGIGGEILQLCMTEIADQLHSAVHLDAPRYLNRSDARLQANADASGDSIWMRFDFKVEGYPIHGHIAFNMTNRKFLERVQEMVKRLGG